MQEIGARFDPNTASVQEVVDFIIDALMQKAGMPAADADNLRNYLYGAGSVKDVPLML
jgi:hypothetical protein